MNKFANVREHETESAMRLAFKEALTKTTEKTNVTGKIFRGMCSHSGIKSIIKKK